MSPTPAERFATTLRWLVQAVAAMSGGDRLSYALIGLIVDRIRGIKQHVARIAERIRAGTYTPRQSAPRRQPTERRPRPPSKLPTTFGWLLPLVPDAIGFRSQLEFLLQDREMAELLAAAPGSLRRPLRSLCWMLRLAPPDILARPAKPRSPAKPAAPAAPMPAPAPRPHAPTRPRAPGSSQWSPARLRGPPRPA
jgi:hypothetical protein